MQAGLDGGDGHAEAGSDLLQRKVGVVVKKDGQPVGGVEARERFDQSGVVLSPIGAVDVGSIDLLVGRRRHPFAAVVDGRVRRELPEPRIEWTRGVVAVEVAVELDEDLLGQVLGFVVVADVLEGEAVDAALEPPDQLFECVEVAAGCLPDELAGRNGGCVRRP